MPLVLSFLVFRYVVDDIDMNIAGFTILMGLGTVQENLILLAIWSLSLARYIGERKSDVICFIISGCLLLFMLLSVATTVVAGHTNIKFRSSNGNCDDCARLIYVVSVALEIILHIIVAVDFGQVCFTAVFIYLSDLEEYKGEAKQRVRLYLAYLSLFSSSIALESFGILYEIPLLSVSHYLLCHIMFILLCDALASYYREHKKQQLQRQEKQQQKNEEEYVDRDGESHKMKNC
jgi:hypothetical protein